MAGRPSPFSTFFPSLSRAIVWKAGAVSRVRFAAQKSRALDTAPAFQNSILLRRKRREGVARLKVTALESGGFNGRHKLKPRPRRTLAYCGQKMVLTMGSTLLLRDPARADAVQIARMDRFWGDGSWHEVAYEVSRQGSLFGEPEQVKVKMEDANERISEAYRKRLIDVAGFAYAPRPLRFVNSLGATIYYLFFASPNQTGDKIIEDIFRKDRKKQGL